VSEVAPACWASATRPAKAAAAASAGKSAASFSASSWAVPRSRFSSDCRTSAYRSQRAIHSAEGVQANLQLGVQRRDEHPLMFLVEQDRQNRLLFGGVALEDGFCHGPISIKGKGAVGISFFHLLPWYPKSGQAQAPFGAAVRSCLSPDAPAG
jgi:hypothetical protein